MSLPLLVTGTIGIDTIITPHGRADGVLGGSVSFAAVAALLFAERVDAVSIIGEDFPSHYEEALTAKGLCMDGVERKTGPSFSWTGEYFDNMNKRRTVCANDSVMLEWNVRIPEALRKHPVLVCCCMVPAQQLKCMEQCPDAGLVLSDSMDKWLRRQPGLLDAVIARSHITMMNEDEAKEYARAATVAEAGEFLLSRGSAYAVVKQGEYGATLLGREEGGEVRIFRCPAYPLKTVVDPTGAGDTFLGALAGYLSTLPEGLPSFEEVKRGIVYGTVAASFTCESFSADALLSMTPGTFRKRLDEYMEMCRMPADCSDFPWRDLAPLPGPPCRGADQPCRRKRHGNKQSNKKRNYP